VHGEILTAGCSNIQEDPSPVHIHSSERQRNMKVGNTRKHSGKEWREAGVWGLEW